LIDEVVRVGDSSFDQDDAIDLKRIRARTIAGDGDLHILVAEDRLDRGRQVPEECPGVFCLRACAIARGGEDRGNSRFARRAPGGDLGTKPTSVAEVKGGIEETADGRAELIIGRGRRTAIEVNDGWWVGFQFLAHGSLGRPLLAAASSSRRFRRSSCRLELRGPVAHDELESIREPELGEDVGDVKLDAPLCDAELAPDLITREGIVSDEVEHLDLARG
jgi:hypothetical protein